MSARQGVFDRDMQFDASSFALHVNIYIEHTLPVAIAHFRKAREKT
jgi:hypothetical protein